MIREQIDILDREGQPFRGTAELLAVALGVVRLVQSPKKPTERPYDHAEPAVDNAAANTLKLDFVSTLGELRLEYLFGTAGVAFIAKFCARELRLRRRK